MDDDKTKGVLLKGAGGANYFIPQTELAQFAIPSKLNPDESVTENAPHLDAFAVQAESEAFDDSTAFIILGFEAESDAEILGVEGEPGADDD
jgi:hypothetical protein